VLDEVFESPDGGLSFCLGCGHASLSGIAGRPGSGVSAGEGAAAADRAMTWLRRAVALDYALPVIFQNETALGPLRDRDDFRLLMMDLAMPVDPLARDD
jgi:hypothetical protein